MSRVSLYLLLAGLCAISRRAAGYIVNPALLAEMPAFASQGQCNALFDLLHVQDISTSFEDDVVNLQKLLPGFLEDLSAKHEGTKFAFASFVDKPIPSAGWYAEGVRKDYCLEIHNTFDEPDSDVFDVIGKLNVGGGKDWQEGQLEALARIAAAPQLKWRTEEGGRPVLSVAVIATDAMPHYPGDAKKLVKKYNEKHPEDQWKVPVDSELFDSIEKIGEDENYGCAEWDYPEPADIGRALKEKGILPIFLLGPSAYPECPEGEKCNWGALRRKAKQTGDTRYLDPMLAQQLIYESLLDEMEMPGIIVMVDDKLEDYVQVMGEALSTVAAIVCPAAPLPRDPEHLPQLEQTSPAEMAHRGVMNKPHPVEQKLAVQEAQAEQGKDVSKLQKTPRANVKVLGNGKAHVMVNNKKHSQEERAEDDQQKKDCRGEKCHPPCHCGEKPCHCHEEPCHCHEEPPQDHGCRPDGCHDGCKHHNCGCCRLRRKITVSIVAGNGDCFSDEDEQEYFDISRQIEGVKELKNVEFKNVEIKGNKEVDVEDGKGSIVRL